MIKLVDKDNKIKIINMLSKFKKVEKNITKRNMENKKDKLNF